MGLQLIGLVIIAWAAAAPDEGSLSRPAKLLLMLAVTAVAIVALQAVPAEAITKFEVDRVCLMQSQLSPHGATHSVVAETLLA